MKTEASASALLEEVAEARTQPDAGEESGAGGNLAWAVLAVAMLACAGLLIALNTQLTFIADEWELLVLRQGWSPGVFLEPFNEHVILGPALVYKTLLAVFGMGSPLPYQLVAIASHLAVCLLLFIWLRRRVGDWAALLGAALILFLGAAFEDLLWAFQLGFFVSIAAGLGALIALDRGDRNGDLIATVLLIVSISFTSVGMIYLLGAAICVLMGDRRLIWRRVYVAGLPLALYALWWLGWGHHADSQIALSNLAGAPAYVLDAAAAGAASLFGLATGDGSEPDQPQLLWGTLILVGLAALIGWRIRRDRRISPGLLVTVAMAVSFWLLLALGTNENRPPASSRYQYPAAIFLLLVLAETLRGLRRPRGEMVVASCLTLVVVASGVELMRSEHEDRWVPFSESIRYSLGAVEIAGRGADPDFLVRYSGITQAPVRLHLDTVEKYGSPADSETDILARPESERAAVDLTLAEALGLRLAPPDPDAEPRGCRPISPAATHESPQPIGPGATQLANRGEVDINVYLRRFASGPSVDLGPVGPGVRTMLRIPRDESARPWTLSLASETPHTPVRLCPD